MFLFSDDPVHEGRTYIESTERHTSFTTASMALVEADGSVRHSGRIEKLRGRGNGTWNHEKKPYQIKFESRMDLLDIDQPADTFVLLAESGDWTLLRNRIALDLGLELGLEETSHSEFIDLYYDGEYRGTYLLAEKVEIGPGRIEAEDYEDRIRAWNENAGHADLDALPTGEGVNRFGSAFTFIEGLEDSGHVRGGAYFLEMENEATTLSDRCYFYMEDGSVVALKNPENASEPMVRFISEYLMDARRTLQNGGVHPETGVSAEEYFDLDAFARLVLLNELAANADGMVYSSSFFVLHPDSGVFEPGPPWDFDLAWRYYNNDKTVDGTGFKDQPGIASKPFRGWLSDFYAVPAFCERMRQIYEKELYPLITQVLLGGKEARYLQSITGYMEDISASHRMNMRRWKPQKALGFLHGETAEEDLALMRRFIAERNEWLYGAVMGARLETDEIQLFCRTAYMHMEDLLELYPFPWERIGLSVDRFEMVEEATEEDYAKWLLEGTIYPDQGAQAFREPRVWLNDTEVSCELQKDGSVKFSALLEDATYKPVDYYGDDIGMVFNADNYMARYPEIAEECEYDAERVMEYFCDEGMYEGQQGNAFFVPAQIAEDNAEVAEMLGEDWQMYYWEYLAYGHDDGWLRRVYKRYMPEISPV